MGITIKATNSTRSFDMGGGGFFDLRQSIAVIYDKELGEHYEKLSCCWSKELTTAWEKRVNEILSDSRFKEEDEDILDFLFASDCSGSISYKTCKKIYDLIKDVDFGNNIFVYTSRSDGKDYEHFKEFLLECYKYKRKMRWT